jgi:hypothetical protein
MALSWQQINEHTGYVEGERCFAWIWSDGVHAQCRQYPDDPNGKITWQHFGPKFVKSMTHDELKRYLEVLVRMGT